MEEEKEQTLFPCFLCSGGLEVKQSKKGKPYFFCDDCGVQVFIRYGRGVARFNALLKSLNGAVIGGINSSDTDFKVISLTNRLIQLKAKISELDNVQWPSFFEDDGELKSGNPSP